MGNCLKGSTADDISLLRGSDRGDAGRESTSSDHLGPIGLGPGLGHQGLGHQGLGPPPVYQENVPGMPVYYPSPNLCRPVSFLTEEEQVKIAKRAGLIQHLPSGAYDGCKRNRECVICMIEFMVGDPVRYLPCMHIYHEKCIDDWLMRSFTCPSCMEPVDAALLTSYETNCS